MEEFNAIAGFIYKYIPSNYYILFGSVFLVGIVLNFFLKVKNPSKYVIGWFLTMPLLIKFYVRYMMGDFVYVYKNNPMSLSDYSSFSVQFQIAVAMMMLVMLYCSPLLIVDKYYEQFAFLVKKYVFRKR